MERRTKEKAELLGAAALIAFIAADIMAVAIMAAPKRSQEPQEAAIQKITVKPIVFTVAEREPVETTPEASQKGWEISDEDIDYIAKTIWGEARGIPSRTEQAAVAWCILNRVDAGEFPGTIAGVVTQPAQFSGYRESYPAEPFRELARDVVERWQAEKAGTEDVGRVLPKEYRYFFGDGKHNHFTAQWKGAEEYVWSLPTPYED